MRVDVRVYREMKDSFVEWLGPVPEHWDVAMTKRHYSIQLGKMLQTAPNRSDDIEVSYLKAKHVQWFNVQIADTPRMWASLRDLEQFGIGLGDLLVCEGGEGGRCGIVRQLPARCIIQNALHRVRHKQKNNNAFFQYVLSSIAERGWFEVLNDKATIAHFTKEKLGTLRIPRPPCDEQLAIVRFLNHADRCIQRYIRAKQKLIALLEEHKQAIIHQAVTGEIDVRTGEPYPSYNASGVDWVRKVPTHWKFIRNGRLFFQRNEIGFPDLPILEVSLKTGVSVRAFGDSDRKQAMLDRGMYKRAVKGDIAYNMMRMWQGAVGVAPVDGLVSPAYVVARPLDGNDARYFSAVFQTSTYMVEVDRYSRGIVKDRNRLYWEDFKQISSPCPPPDEQAAIADALDHIAVTVGEGIKQAEHQIELVREYRTRLIADVVTGKLDVRGAAAQLPGDDRADRAEGSEDEHAVDQEVIL